MKFVMCSVIDGFVYVCDKPVQENSTLAIRYYRVDAKLNVIDRDGEVIYNFHPYEWFNLLGFTGQTGVLVQALYLSGFPIYNMNVGSNLKGPYIDVYYSYTGPELWRRYVYCSNVNDGLRALLGELNV